jgi:hypothetical protein
MHLVRRSVVSSCVAALAALTSACGDPAPPPPVAPAQGAPIAGAPIPGAAAPAVTTIPAPTPTAAAPTAPQESPPVAAAEPPPQTEQIPAIGDPSTREDRLPEDQPVTTRPPEPPPGATPPAVAPPVSTPPVPATTVATPRAAAPADRPAPMPPTTASQADKPTLPDRAPVKDAAADGAAKTESAGPDPSAAGAKSFVPKDLKKGEAIVLTFEQLASFDYTAPPPPSSDPDTPQPDPAIALEAARKQIPPEIWELEGKTVTVEGYMIPLEYVDDGVKAFLISRHAMGCCFGVTPRPHELIECDLGEGKTTPYVGYVPVSVTGVFHVSPPTGPQAMLTGIYRMDAPRVMIPKER